MGIKEKLISIDPSKACLSFLGDRILSDNYRGMQLSQHNRYDNAFITLILCEMYKLVGGLKIAIRTTDLSKRPENTDEELVYATLVNNICIASPKKKVTQDSLRKNFFVDLHRMGFIDRFNKEGEALDPFDRRPVKYVSLTKDGIAFVKNKNDIFEHNLLYTKKVDILTKGLPEEILDVVSINDKLTETEFMFFLSFAGCTLNGHRYEKDELVDFIKEFRNMSYFQRRAVDDLVEQYCDPDTFPGTKINKRDYHNWKNETQQIFMLLDQTVYFEKRDETLFILLGENSLFEDTSKLRRSLKQKEEYFKNHKVGKKIGFELHHVIPLLTAKTKNEFATLDVWENMVYIDGYTHSKISHTNNKNTNLSFNNDDIVLTDPAGIVDEIDCIKDTNVIYDTSNKTVMKEYNDTLLNAI